MKRISASFYHPHFPINHSENISRIFKSIAFIALSIVLLTSCTDPKNSQHWVGTWTTAQQLVEPHNMPPEPGLTDNTLRQVLRVSIGGDSMRIRLSNEFSNSALVIIEARIARSTGGSSIDPATSKSLTFNNNNSLTLEAGTAVYSDALAFDLKNRDNLAITLYYGETAPDVTGHPGSRTTSYLIPGNHCDAPDMTESISTDHWYTIANIDVKAPKQAAAVVVLGNSITDGRGSGTNMQNRWPDILSEQLLANPATQLVGVLNQGIGGNCVLKNCLGPAAIDRFERDVLKQQGVKWLIILEGVNDLGQTPDSAAAMQVANDLIAAYDQMITRAHAKNIKVYGATILPFGYSFYYTPFREIARNVVNDWVRNSGRFDAVIDFDHIMRNPEDTMALLPDLHTGDFLHPNEAGYVTMGQSIDLNLFE
jgi:lysophospholipase L1-like esterase